MISVDRDQHFLEQGEKEFVLLWSLCKFHFLTSSFFDWLKVRSPLASHVKNHVRRKKTSNLFETSK